MTQTPPPQAAIETTSLRKTFAGKVAVDDLSLRVERGEVFGFLGPNGAGKTTSVKMLLGLTRPTSGRGALLGKPIGDPQSLAKTGFLPEHFRFHDWLKAREFLTLHGRLCGMSDADVRRRAGELLDLVGLLPHEDQRLCVWTSRPLAWTR
jgi:ABC-2 type transport system ATP-binding protein